MWSFLSSIDAKQFTSLAMSVVSLFTTLYFWFVKAKRETPSLVLDSVAQHSFVDLGRGSADERWLHFRLAVVIANTSVLPNAAIDIQVLQRPKYSKSWFRCENVTLAEESRLPLNLPPMQTGLILVEWWQSFPTLAEAEALDAQNIASGYVDFYFAERTFKVEVQGMQGRRFASEVAIKNTKPPIAVRRAA